MSSKRYMLITVLIGLFIVSMVGQVSNNNIVLTNNQQDDVDNQVVKNDNNNVLNDSFVTSADGDISDQSITSFSETSADDVMLYPDHRDKGLYYYDLVDSMNTFAWGIALGEVSDSVTYNQTLVELDGFDNSSTLGYTDYDYIYSNSVNIETVLNVTVEFYYMMSSSTGSGYVTIMFYDEDFNIGIVGDGVKYELQDSTSWKKAIITIGVNETFGGSVSSVDKIDCVYFQICQDGDDSFNLYVKDMEIYHSITENNFFESFADVSDWSSVGGYGISAGQYSVSTDGDVANFSIQLDDTGNEYWIWKTTGLSLSLNTYCEVRYWTNAQGKLFIRFYNATSSFFQSYIGGNVASPTTYKYYLGNYESSYPEFGQITEIMIVCDDYDSAYDSGHADVYLDYLRVAPATEMGWQHDGSTTAGVTAENGASVSSDGDLLTVTNDASSQIRFYPDTTSTKTYLDADYYPFLKVQFDSSSIGKDFALEVYDGAYQTLQSRTTISQTTYRYNVKAVVSSDVQFFRFYFYDSDTIVFDYIKLYSIANYSLAFYNPQTNYVLYTESGVLFRKGDATGDYWISLKSDFHIDVDTSVYNVVNITTDADMNDGIHQWVFRDDWYGVWHFEEYNPSADSDIYKYDGWRFTTDRATIDDFQINIYHECSISAIKFWTDTVAPVIENFWITPYTPTDEDEVTLAIYGSDTFDFYSVYFNAVDYPAGFSDVDYTATESANENDLWNYTFSSLVAGYYAWKVYVSDGVHTSTDILTMQVIENSLSITDVVLITSTTDIVQMSARSNKDASYSIYENDTLKGSGSVAAGWFSLSWTKESTAGSYVRLGIKFVNNDDTEWINGSYSVATADTLQVSDIVYTSTDSVNQISGSANLACDYYIYDNDSLQTSSVLTDGSFSITWSKLTDVGLHIWGIKFDDGTTVRWVNGSYSVGVGDVLQITDTIYTSTTDTNQLSGYVNLACDYSIYNNDSIVDSGSLSANTFSISWSKSNDVGLNIWGIKFNDTSTTRWVNGSYYVSSTYSWTYINPYLPSGEGLNLQKFKLYINNTRIYDRDWKAYLDTSAKYNITILDFFNATVYSSVKTWSRGIDILLNLYTFKVCSTIDDSYIYFKLTSSAGNTYSEYIMPREIVSYYLYTNNTYTYSYNAALNGTSTQTYTGTITVSGDVAVVIVDWGVEKILDRISDVENYAQNGGGTSSALVAGVNSVAIQVWQLRVFIYGLGFLIVGLSIFTTYLNRNNKQVSSVLLPTSRSRSTTVTPTVKRESGKRYKSKTTEEIAKEKWGRYAHES